MKKFEVPKMTMVRLLKEDIVTSSSCAEYGFCDTYTCDNCGTCSQAYNCLLAFECHSYKK